MIDLGLAADQRLLVAARGKEASHGLWSFAIEAGHWRGRQLARVAQLSSLCRHPTLPVVYGTAIVERVLHAWRLDGPGASAIGQVPSGAEPCQVAVDPSGRLLVCANYDSSDLTLVPLAGDGGFAADPVLLRLSGSGPDRDRQEAAHPHQVLFHDGLAVVIDLGADCLRRFRIDEAGLVPLDTIATPPGSGPRHAVFLPGGRIAIADELASALTVGAFGDAPGWTSIASTFRTGPAKTRSRRNYPGDIERAPDGRHVYLANRGHDTIAAFDVAGATPKLVAEIDAAAAWPQHLLVLDTHLVAAGWDGDAVTVMPLAGGVPGKAETLFECPGPGWLLLFKG